MLRIENITKGYQIREDKRQEVLKGLSVTLQDTGFVSILGSSGNGKTTLLNIIGGLDSRDGGKIYYHNEEILDYESFRRQNIGFVFQEYNLIEHLTIVDNVILSMPDNVEEKHEKASQILRDFGLMEHLHKKPNQLSGGQKQRVAIARMIAKDVKIIVCDEPTGNLDATIETKIAENIKELSKTRLVLLVTHNRDLAEKYSDRILEIEDGRILKDTGDYESETAEDNSEEVSFDKKPVWLARKNVLGRKKETAKIVIYSFVIMFLAVLSIILNSGLFKDFMHEIRVENGLMNMFLDIEDDTDIDTLFTSIDNDENVGYTTYIYDYILKIGGPDIEANRIFSETLFENFSGNKYLEDSITVGRLPEASNEVVMSTTGAITLLMELGIGGERLNDQFMTGELDNEYVFDLIDDKTLVVFEHDFPRFRVVGVIDDSRVYEEGHVIYHIDGFEALFDMEDQLDVMQIKIYKNELYRVNNIALYEKYVDEPSTTINEDHQYNVDVEYNKIHSFLQFAKIGLYTIIVISSITYISLLFNSLNERKYEIGLYRSVGFKSKGIMKILGSEMLLCGLISSSIVLVLLFIFALVMYLMPYNLLTFFQVLVNLNIIYIIPSILMISIVGTLIVIYVNNRRNLSKTIISNISNL